MSEYEKKVYDRMLSMHIGQSAEFVDRVYIPVDDNSPFKGMTVAQTLAYPNNVRSVRRHRTGRVKKLVHRPLRNNEVVHAHKLLRNAVVFSEETIRFAEPERRYCATMKVEHRFDASLDKPIGGLYITLSITVYRVR